MKKILSILLIVLAGSAFSQEIVFSEDVASDTVRPTRGPNLKKFMHPYIAIGFPFHTDEALDYTKAGASSVFDYGVRFKRKLNNTFAVGMDISMNWAAYKIKQKDGKSVPDSIRHDQEKFQVNSLTPAVYARINVGRRGNYIGNYLDLGAYGSWNFRRAHKTTDKNSQDELVKVMTTRLDYMEPLSYGVLARIGVNRYVLTARYRLSDLFTESSKLPELPRLSAGIEFGLFK